MGAKKHFLQCALALLIIWSSLKTTAQNFLDKYLTDPLTYSIIATSSDGINQPRDLDFKPFTNELWVVNYGTVNGGGSTTIFYNAGLPNQTSQFRKDSHTSHFMVYPSALAFSDIGEFGTTGEIKNSASPNSTFMGPSLWSADTNIFGKVFQNNWVNGYPLGSHLDMLHQSPFAMGIAHDSAKAYWVFDGYNSNICKYDYVADHSPGYDNHSAGKIWRYTDVNVLRAPGIPSHMVLDKTSKWLYIVDAGNKKLLRILSTSGTIAGNLSVPNTASEPLVSYKAVTGCTQQVIDTYTSQPCGIDYYNNRLIVGDYATGDIRVYDTSVPTPTLIGIIATGQSGIMGVKIGYDGKIWFVNNTQSKIVRIDPSNVTNDASIAEIISPTVENAEVKFYTPAFINCVAGSIVPVVKLENRGSNNLTSVNINYIIDVGGVNTYSWTGNLAAGSVANVTLVSSNISAGTHKLKVYTSNPNAGADMNNLNDRKEGSFRSVDAPSNLPFSEDFSATIFPPLGWSYVGYNKFCKMSRNASVGGFANSFGALQMDNFTGPMNITGQKDYFISPRINLSSASEITFLSFDLAYAQRTPNSTDNLDVSISTDCGANWTSVYSKTGSVLSTTNNLSYAYTPAAPEEWRTDSIDLAAYKGLPEVLLMFTTNSNYGNNLYLDNINLTTVSTVGLSKNKLTQKINVYPNPSSGKFIVDGLLAGGNNKIRVLNILGAELVSINQIDKEKVELDLSFCSEGTYFVQIESEKSVVIKKVVINRN